MDDYVVKYIKRKNKRRKIVTYRDGSSIRKYHEDVVNFLKKNTYNSIFAKAYIEKTSIYMNASAHLYNDIFIKIDIKQFFPSIDLKVLETQLYKEICKRGEISRYECHEIVEKCSVGKRGLPLGLVSSPALANIYLKEFDGVLYGTLKKMNLNNPIYTRYADDMVVSFKGERGKNYNDTIDAIIGIVKKLLRKFKLTINEKKTQVVNMYKSNHVRITGVSITRSENGYRHISVGKKMKNSIFWSAINMYDDKDVDYEELLRLKGKLSFVLSIEKKGIEDSYSEKMMSLLKARGVESVKELLDKIGK